MYSWLLLQSKGLEGTNQRIAITPVSGRSRFSWPILAQRHQSSKTLMELHPSTSSSLEPQAIQPPSLILETDAAAPDCHGTGCLLQGPRIHHALGDEVWPRDASLTPRNFPYPLKSRSHFHFNIFFCQLLAWTPKHIWPITLALRKALMNAVYSKPSLGQRQRWREASHTW